MNIDKVMEDIKNGTIEHDLKILPEYFDDVQSGRKKFELRKNDRNYQPGGIFVLREWNGKYTGRFYIGSIGYVLEDCREHGLIPGYCIFCW